MSELKTLKEAMEDWDQEDVARFISERQSYTESDSERDILSEKINLLAELVDQKIDLVLKADTSDKIHLDTTWVMCRNLREAAKEWRDTLKAALEHACEKHEGVYNNTKLEIAGVTYEASAFEDDEAKPIIKFINHFFNLEDDD